MSDSTRTVHCRKFDTVLPGLESPPIPGAVGQDIYDHVSARAWAQWQHLQTMLINEHHLSLMEPDARKFLLEQMGKFLDNGDYERPTGYVPEV